MSKDMEEHFALRAFPRWFATEACAGGGMWCNLRQEWACVVGEEGEAHIKQFQQHPKCA